MKQSVRPVKKEKIQEIVYGIHPVVELLKAKKRKVYTIVTTKPYPKAWNSIESVLTKEIQVHQVGKDVLNRMAGTTDHQSVIAFAAPYQFRKRFFEASKSPFLLLLDSIQDPRNLGAILRSAYCTNVDGVIICQKQGAPLNAVAIKSSAGLSEHLEIYQASSVAAAVNELISGGYKIYAATLNGENATTTDYKSPMCLVIGNESTGVTKNILPSCIQVKLPQRRVDISYNASVAAGILLFIIAMNSKRRELPRL